MQFSTVGESHDERQVSLHMGLGLCVMLTDRGVTFWCTKL